MKYIYNIIIFFYYNIDFYLIIIIKLNVSFLSFFLYIDKNVFFIY